MRWRVAGARSSQLFAGNEFLMERRLFVVQVPEVQS
jgi:hypothetical protein